MYSHIGSPEDVIKLALKESKIRDKIKKARMREFTNKMSGISIEFLIILDDNKRSIDLMTKLTNQEKVEFTCSKTGEIFTKGIIPEKLVIDDASLESNTAFHVSNNRYPNHLIPYKNEVHPKQTEARLFQNKPH
jgi:hypothetical protein